MTSPLLDKARSRRKAALASLDARNQNTDESVVSLFDFDFIDKKPQPEIRFISQRSADSGRRFAA